MSKSKKHKRLQTKKKTTTKEVTHRKLTCCDTKSIYDKSRKHKLMLLDILFDNSKETKPCAQPIEAHYMNPFLNSAQRRPMQSSRFNASITYFTELVWWNMTQDFPCSGAKLIQERFNQQGQTKTDALDFDPALLDEAYLERVAKKRLRWAERPMSRLKSLSFYKGKLHQQSSIFHYYPNFIPQVSIASI